MQLFRDLDSNSLMALPNCRRQSVVHSSESSRHDWKNMLLPWRMLPERLVRSNWNSQMYRCERMQVVVSKASWWSVPEEGENWRKIVVEKRLRQIGRAVGRSFIFGKVHVVQLLGYDPEGSPDYRPLSVREGLGARIDCTPYWGSKRSGSMTFGHTICCYYSTADSLSWGQHGVRLMGTILRTIYYLAGRRFLSYEVGRVFECLYGKGSWTTSQKGCWWDGTGPMSRFICLSSTKRRSTNCLFRLCYVTW